MTPGQVLEEERKERAEHRDAVLDLRAVLETAHGQRFFKYLFKNLDVGELPEMGLEGNMLFEYLGFLRAGKSIFELMTEADVIVTARLIAEKEKDRNARLYSEALPEPKN